MSTSLKAEKGPRRGSAVAGGGSLAQDRELSCGVSLDAPVFVELLLAVGIPEHVCLDEMC